MKLKTVGNKGEIRLKDYSDSQCQQILSESSGYQLRLVRSWGSDYGGSQCDEHQETLCEEILPERVLVQNGHFFGVLLLTEYRCYNGGASGGFRETLLKAGDKDACAREGTSFSNDDHDRWDYTDYYLEKK